MVDSVAGFNNDGFYALGASGGFSFSATVYVSRSTTVSNVRNGIRADQNAEIWVSQSNVQSDTWANTGNGCVTSYGDNESGGSRRRAWAPTRTKLNKRIGSWPSRRSAARQHSAAVGVIGDI